LRINDERVAQRVKLSRGHTGNDVRRNEIKNFCGFAANMAHALNVFWSFDGDGHAVVLSLVATMDDEN